MPPKPGSDHAALTRRERQIMDILYRRGRATANDVLDDLPGTPALLDRPHAAARPRRERARHARRGRRAVRLHAGGAPARRAEVGAASSRRHVLRRIGRAGRRRCARRRRREALGRGAGSYRGAHRQSEERRKPMKMSLIVFGALAVSFLLRRRSAALRHWVLAAGSCVRGGHAAARLPLVPPWPLPFATPTAFTSYQDPLQGPVQASRSAAPMRPPRSASWSGRCGLFLRPRRRPAASTSSPRSRPSGWPERSSRLRFS